MYPKAKLTKDGTGRFVIGSTVSIGMLDKSLKGAVEYFQYAIKSVYGIECVTVSKDPDIEIIITDMSAEEYHLNIANNGILIEASDTSGVVYALSTLLQLIKCDMEFYIECIAISDAPFAEIRGVHFYMPERARIDQFKRIVDTLAFFKMNTVILEVGGAMEYERHPEINEAWAKFCDNIKKFPGYNGYKSFQASDFYWKDSVHTEQAGGSYLTKSEVRDLVLYAKSRGMNVIPEVQGLSHCYYLTIAHPEIAELSDDPFPDTYCPSNEKSYELYFDVAEEVIEVFEPSIVSIGHDEIRVLGWCDKCKDKSGDELVGGEILRLYDFYTSKGIRIAMWGESVQTFISYKGGEVGKKDIETTNRYGAYYKLPSSYKALDILPNDILMLDWQHSSGHDSEECYNEQGFEVIYGNFQGSLIGEWETRTAKDCFRGAEVSSWCPATEEIFARDGLFFEIAFSSEILWNEGYTNKRYTEVCENIAAAMPYVRALNKGERSLLSKETEPEVIYIGNEDKAYQKITLDNCKYFDNEIYKALVTLPKMLSGVSVDTGNIIIKKELYSDGLLFIHNSKKEIEFLPSHFFCNEAKWALGSYAVCYEDGTVELANIYYGRQIGVNGFKFTRHRDVSTRSFEIDNELEEGESVTVPCYFTKDFDWTESLTYNTIPIITDNGTLFVYEWKNPHPDKKITRIRPYHIPKRYNEYDLDQSIVLFAILSI